MSDPGGLSPDHQDWIRPKYAGFFLPIKVLSRCFAGSLSLPSVAPTGVATWTLPATERLRDPAQWHTFVDALFETDWIVYAKPAFGGASRCCGIWGATRIGSRSATID